MGLLRSINDDGGGGGGGGDRGDPPTANTFPVTDEEVMRFVEEEEDDAAGSGVVPLKKKRSFFSSIRRRKDKDGATAGGSSAAGTMAAEVRDDGYGDGWGGAAQPQAPSDVDVGVDGTGGQHPQPSTSTLSLGRNPSFALKSLVNKLSSRGDSGGGDVEGDALATGDGATDADPSEEEDVGPPPTREVRFEGPISSMRGSPQRRRRIEQPSARESAFSGAARYDWIDIETAAACKVQAAYRRAKTCEYLESRNMTTSFMRNRRRERKYRKNLPDHAASEDVPALLQMCGIGLLFGDAVEEDTYENREAAMLAEHRERRKEEAIREYELRESGIRRSGMSNYRSSRVEEMVDDL